MLNIQLSSYQIIFITIGLIGVLLFASPTIAFFIKPPAAQEFSEIYVLGPNHTFENLPFNIKTGVTYLTYLGVGNNLGQSAYYTCYVKLGNGIDPLPDTKLQSSSGLPALYEYRLFVKNGETWQAPFTLEFNKIDFENNSCRLSSISINGVDVPVNKTSAWDSNKQGFYYNLIVELWLFNSTLGSLQFNNRFVSLPLNMTK